MFFAFMVTCISLLPLLANNQGKENAQLPTCYTGFGCYGNILISMVTDILGYLFLSVCNHPCIHNFNDKVAILLKFNAKVKENAKPVTCYTFFGCYGNINFGFHGIRYPRIHLFIHLQPSICNSKAKVAITGL